MRINSAVVVFACFAWMASAPSVWAGNCPGAVPDDNIDDSAAINFCLANNPTSVILAYGTYDIDATLNLTRDNLIFTGEFLNGVPPGLLARPGLVGPMLLTSADADGWELSGLAFVGNKANRTNAASCAGYRGNWNNLNINGTFFLIHHIASNETLCGSAMEVQNASNYVIRDNQFWDNGSETGPGAEPWSDGITLWKCPDGDVLNNFLINSTDVALIVGGGFSCEIQFNEIIQQDSFAYAGFMVHKFSDGLHATSLYHDQTIRSGLDKLGFGIMVGSHPWDPNITIEGGSVYSNYIEGAVYNLVVDGISQGSVQNNTTVGNQGTRGWPCFSGETFAYTVAHKGTADTQPGEVAYQHHSPCGPPQ